MFIHFRIALLKFKLYRKRRSEQLNMLLGTLQDELAGKHDLPQHTHPYEHVISKHVLDRESQHDQMIETLKARINQDIYDIPHQEVDKEIQFKKPLMAEIAD